MKDELMRWLRCENGLGEADAVEDYHQQAHEGIAIGRLNQSFEREKKSERQPRDSS